MSGRTSQRIILIVVAVTFTAAMAPISSPVFSAVTAATANAALGLALGLATIAAAALLDRSELRTLLGALAGMVAGALVAAVVVQFLPAGTVAPLLGPAEPNVLLGHLRPMTSLLLLSLGTLVGAARGARFSLTTLRGKLRDMPSGQNDKILDTSVIIDGRITDICASGFLDGRIVIPQFVLRELQAVADSSDHLKRNRGRKGLEVLQRLQRQPGLEIEIVNIDFPAHPDVDQKLIALARQLRGKLVTTDFNLNKVAELHGLAVLNINDLANSLKPVVLPGETLRVFILKEGTEERQGVAYLDDGTMVVIDDARQQIGRTIEVTITSVLQTTVGKMFFARYEHTAEPGSGGSRHRETISG